MYSRYHLLPNAPRTDAATRQRLQGPTRGPQPEQSHLLLRSLSTQPGTMPNADSRRGIGPREVWNMPATGKDILNVIREQLDLSDYRKVHWEGSFEEYLDIVRDHPDVTRTAYQRLYDMI